MPKVNVGVEVKSVKVFESKFEPGGIKAAKAAVEKAFKTASNHALGPPKEGGHILCLKVNVELDKAGRTVKGSCKWEISVIENGQRKAYFELKQVKPATATVPDVNPAKVTQLDIDEAVAGAVEAEVTGILKKLPY